VNENATARKKSEDERMLQYKGTGKKKNCQRGVYKIEAKLTKEI
jgi:hypothetical protein